MCARQEGHVEVPVEEAPLRSRVGSHSVLGTTPSTSHALFNVFLFFFPSVTQFDSFKHLTVVCTLVSFLLRVNLEMIGTRRQPVLESE